MKRYSPEPKNRYRVVHSPQAIEMKQKHRDEFASYVYLQQMKREYDKMRVYEEVPHLRVPRRTSSSD